MAPVLSDSVIVFLLSLLIGAIGVHIGATVLAGTDDFGEALLTALVGAIVWAVLSYAVSWIPILGPLLTLVAYVAVIKWRYNIDWVRAVGVALIAWIVAIGVLVVLARLGINSLNTVGVPRIPPGPMSGPP